MGNYNQETEETYTIKKGGNGVYAFVLEGNATINGQDLGKRDGFGVWDTSELTINSKPGTKLLLMEVPMN